MNIKFIYRPWKSEEICLHDRKFCRLTEIIITRDYKLSLLTCSFFLFVREHLSARYCNFSSKMYKSCRHQSCFIIPWNVSYQKTWLLFWSNIYLFFNHDRYPVRFPLSNLRLKKIKTSPRGNIDGQGRRWKVKKTSSNRGKLSSWKLTLLLTMRDKKLNLSYS